MNIDGTSNPCVVFRVGCRQSSIKRHTLNPSFESDYQHDELSVVVMDSDPSRPTTPSGACILAGAQDGELQEVRRPVDRLAVPIGVTPTCAACLAKEAEELRVAKMQMRREIKMSPFLWFQVFIMLLGLTVFKRQPPRMQNECNRDEYIDELRELYFTILRLHIQQ
ncbi:uncharacterized protein IUM83_07035 [Phytophthora cinnamomi]|uniref:uncharacterized protein n=1 Tax=Phytophthora cinnamomi TaxID=4785 RepID=UPI0035598ECF|nr:hypothetical protein IUM83_07035 [Phytophthora cinnamomi]